MADAIGYNLGMDETPSFSIDDNQLVQAIGRFGFAAPVAFDSSAFPTEFLRRAEEDLRESAGRYPLHRESDFRAKVREWAGHELGAMTASREATKSYLKHPDANRRRAATCLATSFWGTSIPFFVADCLRLAFEDPDCTVRGAALRSLSLLYHFVADRTGWLGRLFVMTAPVRWRTSDLASGREIPDELAAEARDRARWKWEQLAGPHYAAQMESSREAAENCLDHPDANIRRAAIMVLSFKWNAKDVLAARCEALLTADSDISVRCEAAYMLGMCYRRADDVRIGRLLADLICDESTPMELRESAYKALIFIRKAPEEAFGMIFRGRSREFDWEFVNSFREMK